MSTAVQIAANHANSQFSTGPRDTTVTRHNATRHGLTGKQVVIKGEDPAEYDAFREELIGHYSPASEREAMLVEEIAQNWWRLQRARRVETQVIEKFGTLEVVLDPEANKAWKTITRYVNQIERTWNRACRDLEALQKSRNAQEQKTLPKIGFVSSIPKPPAVLPSTRPPAPASSSNLALRL